MLFERRGAKYSRMMAGPVAFVRKEAVRRVERLVLGGVLLFIAALLTRASILHMHAGVYVSY